MNLTSDTIWEKIQRGVFIIAEAGKNFIQTEEDRPIAEYLQNAKELVDKAVWAGADAIKFQTHNVEDEILNVRFESPHAKGIDRYAWVIRNTEATPVDEFWRPLREYCDSKGIIFFSAPFSRGAAHKLFEAGSQLWKIGSADILDFVCMDYLRQSQLPIIMSSGMSTFEEIEKALTFLSAKNSRVALLHCLSKYPGLPEEANLATMELFRERFPGVPIGFSENSLSIDTSTTAVAMGAKIVERHFTTSRKWWGADHHICSEPEEFKELVERIRKMEASERERQEWLKRYDVQTVRGKKEKNLLPDEAALRPIWRKALMAGRDIPAGTVLKPEMVYAMRPQLYAGGLPSERYEEVIGRKVTRDLKKYDPITFNYLQ